MKKLFLLALICSMSLAMVGCGSEENEVLDDEVVYDEIDETEDESQEELDEEFALVPEFEEDANTAIEILKGYSGASLDLPAEVSEYTIIPDDSYTDLDGTQVIGVSVHTDLGDRSPAMASFYVDVENETVYKFDLATGTNVVVEK